MSTKSRREAEKEGRKEEILKAAEKVMSLHGIYGLNIELIAQETQLATGTIYLYFKNKEEILSTLTVKAREMLFSEFQKIERSELDSIEKLKNMVICNYLFYKKNPLHYNLVSLYEANAQLRESEEMYRSSEKITHLVQGVATEARNNGSLNPHIDPLHFTVVLWGMTVGLLQLIKVRGHILKEKLDISEDDLLKSFLQVFTDGIEKK